jgi:hypothetical protein
MADDNSPALVQDTVESARQVIDMLPADFSKETLDAYKENLEKPQSIPGRTIEFLSTGAKRMWEIFQKADLLGKVAAVGAVGLAAAAAHKIIEKITGINIVEKGIALFRSTWDSMSNLGDKLGTAFDFLRNGTKEKLLLSLGLGTGAVGVAGVGMFYALVKDSWGDIWMEAGLNPKGMIAGILDSTVDRIASGEIDIPGGEWWDDIAEEHDWLPTRAELPGLREKGAQLTADIREGTGELLEDVTEGISETVDWVMEFDERGRLKQLRDEIRGFFADKGITGWETMAAIQALDDPARIAGYLGLATPAARKGFYEEMERNVSAGDLGIAGAIGGGTYLLHKLLKSDWKETLAMTGANVALYMLLQHAGVREDVVGVFDSLHEVVSDAQVEIEKITRHFNIQPEFLNMGVGEFNLKTAMDYLFEFAKENPEFTVLTTLNVAVLSRELIRAVAVQTFKLMFMTFTESAEFAMNNPWATGFVGTLGALTLIQRNDAVHDLALVLYPGDDPDSQRGRREFIDDMRRYLEKTGVLAIEDQPDVIEAATKPIWGRVEDAAEFVNNPDNHLEIIEHMKQGKLALTTHAIGTGFNWTFAVMAGGNPIWTGIKMEQYAVEALVEEMTLRGLSRDNFGIYVTYAGEIIIGTRAIIGAGKGYASLFTDINDLGSGIRFLKSFLPTTKEYFHVLSSAAREAGDTLPYAKFTRMWHAFRVSRLTIHTNKYVEYFEKLKTLDPESAEYKKAYRKLNTRATNIARLCEPLRGDLIKFQDIEFFERLSALSRNAQVATEGIVDGEFKDHAVEKLVREVAELETQLSRKLTMGRQLGEFDRMRGADAPVSIRHGQEVTLKQIDKLKSPTLRSHALELSRLGLSHESLLLLDKSPTLSSGNPGAAANIRRNIAELKADPKLAPKLNQLAYQKQYARSLKFVKAFHKYGGLAMTVAIVWGFHHADNKADFLVETGSHLTGFAAGVAAVRTAEVTVTGKLPPYVRLPADLLVGLAGATGIGAPMNEFFSSKLYRSHPNVGVEGTKALEDLTHEFGSAFDVLTAAGMGRGMFDQVDEYTHPVDYLSHTIRTFKPLGEKDYFKGSMRKEYYHRFDDDLVFNSQQQYDHYDSKRTEKLAELDDLDPSSKKAIALESDIEELDRGMVRLQTFIDGSWQGEVQIELMMQTILVESLKTQFAEIANKEFPGQFGDRGRGVVTSMVTRMGSGQEIIDEEDMDVWQYMFDYPPIKLGDDDDSQEISFRDFVLLAGTVKRRKRQMDELGYGSQPSNDVFDDLEEPPEQLVA